MLVCWARSITRARYEKCPKAVSLSCNGSSLDILWTFVDVGKWMLVILNLVAR